MEKFLNFEWLKDSGGSWSYARVIGTISICSNLIWRMYMGVGDINTYPSAIAGCCGIVAGIALWLIELFRENKRISVRVGEKEYGAKIGD